mgnify:FL=1
MNLARNYAMQFAYSHVEEISTRAWVWNNFPRYRVYQNDYIFPQGEFSHLADAISLASQYSHASVRDLQSTGWVWNNYPRFRLHQGDQTMDAWNYTTLAAATAEARKWGNAHIIDLSNNQWVWDNISPAQKQENRNQSRMYQVYQNTNTTDAWKFSSLENAVQEALKWSNSIVVNINNPKVPVFSNLKPYVVYQNVHSLESFINLDDAITYAEQFAHAEVKVNAKSIWSNYPTYLVFQNNVIIGEYFTIPQALQYAMQYSNASIQTDRNDKIWDNERKLLYWAWNGVAEFNAIRNQANQTLGMDVSSPSWFQLADAEGNLKDSSTVDTVAYLKKQGFTVHPLVTNQFNSTLTTQFLANPTAQLKFITSMVKRSSELGVNGINIDFENISGKDRNAFTGFVQLLTQEAHTKGLLVSIDLPRGSVKWNHLSAFDHEKIAATVDYIMTMTYDQYYSGSTEPGSVAGLQWTEEGIKEFLIYGIPRDKLLLGIPFYTREWTLDSTGKLLGNTHILTKDIPKLMASKQVTSTWDEKFQQYRIEYVQDGNRHVFWLENEETLQARVEIAKKYKLAGVAVWRLGHEPAESWKTMIQLK